MAETEWIMAGAGQFNAWIESWLAAVNTKVIEEKRERICRLTEQALITAGLKMENVHPQYILVFLCISP
jgi:hypothetical protein